MPVNDVLHVFVGEDAIGGFVNLLGLRVPVLLEFDSEFLGGRH